MFFMSEHDIQAEFFRRIRILETEEPVLLLLHAIPNQGLGGKSGIRHTSKLVAEGLRKGWPDCCLPVPSDDKTFTALYLEFKSDRGRLSPEQFMYLNMLTDHGAMCAVVKDATVAVELVMEYIKDTGKPDKPLPDRIPPIGKNLELIVCNN